MPAHLEDATRAFYVALNDVLGGNVAPMLAVWSHADDVTYMSPFGELLVGWEPVRASWEAQADQRLGGQVEPDELRHFVSDTLGFVVGIERESVEIGGVATVVDIRATSMYRVEEDRWVMIGHHTDPLN
jgi:ketosteroid isomerase-like protein